MNIEISSPKGIFLWLIIENVQEVMHDLITNRRGRVDLVVDEKNRFGKF